MRVGGHCPRGRKKQQPCHCGLTCLGCLCCCRAALLVLVAAFVLLQPDFVEADLPVHCVHSQVPLPTHASGARPSLPVCFSGAGPCPLYQRAWQQKEGGGRVFSPLSRYHTESHCTIHRCWGSGSFTGGLVSSKRYGLFVFCWAFPPSLLNIDGVNTETLNFFARRLG